MPIILGLLASQVSVFHVNCGELLMVRALEMQGLRRCLMVVPPSMWEPFQIRSARSCVIFWDVDLAVSVDCGTVSFVSF